MCNVLDLIIYKLSFHVCKLYGFGCKQYKFITMYTNYIKCNGKKGMVT